MPTNCEEVWRTFLPNHGSVVRIFLSYLASQGDFIEEAGEAIRKIGKETTIGPIMDPSAYTDGRRYDNASKYIQILVALIELAKEVQSENLPRQNSS